MFLVGVCCLLFGWVCFGFGWWVVVCGITFACITIVVVIGWMGCGCCYLFVSDCGGVVFGCWFGGLRLFC